MSSFLAGCVGQLGREGVISTRRGPTTGYWSYLPSATQAARRPAPAEGETLTWVELATQRGLDPDQWEL